MKTSQAVAVTLLAGGASFGATFLTTEDLTNSMIAGGVVSGIGLAISVYQLVTQVKPQAREAAEAAQKTLEQTTLEATRVTQAEAANTRIAVRDEAKDLKETFTQVAQEQTSQIAAEVRAMLIAAGISSGLNIAQVTAILASFGHEDVPQELWAAKLTESAARLKDLEARLSAPSNDDPEIAVLLASAGEAIQAGAFDKADGLLAEAERRDLEAGELRITRAARSIEQRADLATTEGRYIEAADHFARAATLVRPFDALDWARLKYNEGWAANQRGKRDPDRGTLDRAVAAYREALKESTRERVPLEWATTQNNLGAVLQTLGARGDDAALADAVTAYREALKEHTRERVPLEWAKTQNNLGNALRVRGERGDDAALADAIIAYREALKESTRERVPLEWAKTQNNLGNALQHLGERGDDAALADAIIAYREALKESTRERAPLEWAITQINLGTALRVRGERGDDAALADAIIAYREALKESTRERVPLYWAVTQNNLGRALTTRGDLTGNRADWEAAAACFRNALLEFTETRAPAYWRVATKNLARVEAKLAA